MRDENDPARMLHGDEAVERRLKEGRLRGVAIIRELLNGEKLHYVSRETMLATTLLMHSSSEDPFVRGICAILQVALACEREGVNDAPLG